MSFILKVILGATFLILLLIPGYTFFIVNGENLDNLYSLFRLLGLYGFTFIWGQLVLGSFMPLLRRLFGSVVLTLHITEGIFAIVFATLHPLVLGLAYYTTTKNPAIWNAFVDYLPVNLLYGYIGVIAWILVICTVVTALLRTNPWFINKWRYIHYLNYVLFILVFIHSYNIGSDIKSEPLNTLYTIFGVTFIISILYRIIYKRILAGWLKPNPV